MRTNAKLKLEKLLEHGRRNVWDPEHDVDWSASSLKLERLSREEREALASVLSLVYHSDAQGKRILQTMCRSLDRQPATDIPLSEKVHEFFLQQMDDEERHARGLDLLFKRLGLEIENKAMSHVLYSKVLLADRVFDAKLVLIYWYIEILAKGVFEELRMRFPKTCIEKLFTRIIRDEARHVGFGEIYIPEHVKSRGMVPRGEMALAYYSTAVALPALFKFSHYSKAARVLGFDLGRMFAHGMKEVAAKAERLPPGSGMLDIRRVSDMVATLL